MAAAGRRERAPGSGGGGAQRACLQASGEEARRRLDGAAAEQRGVQEHPRAPQRLPESSRVLLCEIFVAQSPPAPPPRTCPQPTQALPTRPGIPISAPSHAVCLWSPPEMFGRPFRQRQRSWGNVAVPSQSGARQAPAGHALPQQLLPVFAVWRTHTFLPPNDVPHGRAIRTPSLFAVAGLGDDSAAGSGGSGVEGGTRGGGEEIRPGIGTAPRGERRVESPGGAGGCVDG